MKDMPKDLIGVDLSVPLHVVLSDHGRASFPAMRNRHGIARAVNYSDGSDQCSIQRNGRWQTFHRSFWRLRQ